MLVDYNKTYKPFLYPWAVELAVKHEKIHWVESEITLEEDINDWKRNKINNDEKLFITQILRLFTQSDVAVGTNYFEKFIPIFRNNEIRSMLASFGAREFIHQRAYSLLNDSLGLPEDSYSIFLTYKEMADKIDFMLNSDIMTNSDIALCLAKSVFNEGIMLFASFILLLNFQRRGLMKGMGKVVQWSVRDETVHVEGLVKLFKTFCSENPIVNNMFKHTVYEMGKKVVTLEDCFLDLVYNNIEIEGLSKQEVKQYIRYLCDRRFIQLGLKGIFKEKTNPLPWVEYILNAPDHTNFFENRVVDYEVGNITGTWEY